MAMGFVGDGSDKVVSTLKDITVGLGEVKGETQDWRDATVRLNLEGTKLGRTMDTETKLLSKLKNAFYATNYGGMHAYYNTLKGVVITTAEMVMGSTELTARQENLSIAQNIVGKGLLQHFRIMGWGQKQYAKYLENMDEENTTRNLIMLGLIRQGVTFISMILSALTLVTVLGLLSLAFQGVNSPLYEMTEGMGNLHNLVQGMEMAVSGEGEGNIFDVLGASLILAGAAAWIFSGPFGVIVGLAMLAGGIFNLIYNEWENLMGSLAASGAIMGGLLAVLATLSYTVLGYLVSIVGFFSPMLADAIYIAEFLNLFVGLAAILGGFFVLLGVATGKWSDGMAVVATIFASILFYVGAVALGIATWPVAVFFAWTIVAAWLIRKRKWIWDKILQPILSFIVTICLGAITLVGKLLWTTINGLYNFITGPGAWLERQIDRIIGFFGGHSEPSGFIGMNSPEAGRTRALGGPVTMGRSYLVGERGPEMFVPGSSGTIVPNNKMGGNNITLNINVGGVTDRTDKRALAREISDMISQEVRRSGGQPTRGRF